MDWRSARFSIIFAASASTVAIVLARLAIFHFEKNDLETCAGQGFGHDACPVLFHVRAW